MEFVKTNLTLTNIEALEPLAAHAGINEQENLWKYGWALQVALETHNLISNDSVGRTLEEVLAGVSVFEIFDVLHDSGIERPAFDDYDSLMQIYCHPDGKRIFSKDEPCEYDFQICEMCGEVMEVLSNNMRALPDDMGYTDPRNTTGHIEVFCPYCGKYEYID